MRPRASYIIGIAAISVLVLCPPQAALAQLNQNCTVSVLNRNVQVNSDGTWVLPNIPANTGQVKARATCVQNGVTTSGESAFFTAPANGAVDLPKIVPGSATQIPVSLSISPTPLSFTGAGQTRQLVVMAAYPNASTKNVSAASTGTNYTTSNANIATVGPGGLVTAVSSGTVVIQATNDGAAAIVSASVVLSNTDSDGDGIPDDVELRLGLDPHNPVDAQEDLDRDGLTNLQEYLLGTDIRKADTDSDGLSDGDEINTYQTNPLLADTDGDKIPDGVEVQTGSNPKDSNSYDLKKAAASSVVQPPAFVLSTSVLFPGASVLLNWKVTLIDGKTLLDLTADSRTNYNSSDLTVCNFGAAKGQVFAGSPGSCMITITNNTLSVTVSGTVQPFTPTEISTLNIAGAVAVDVGGTFGYIAAGSNGLVVVDLNDRTRPRTRGTLAGLGDAEAVRVAGQYVLIADANGLLRIVQVLNPDVPVLVASLPIAGQPTALALHGNFAAVAAQSGGVSLVDIGNPAAPSLITTFTVPGSAIGVDFDIPSGLAAVAMGPDGVQLVDISNPNSPRLRGLLPGGDVNRVLLRSSAALLADDERGFTSVNIINPDIPTLSSSIPSFLGGEPVDVASFGSIAMTAGFPIFQGVPIIDISNPLQPNTLLFLNLRFRNFSSSIAMDASFGYLITPDTLHLIQYRQIIDTAGIAPKVQITSPTSEATLLEGSTITFNVNATDDVGVASVSFLVNGKVVLEKSGQPYQLPYTVPFGATSLRFGAIALDYGNNAGIAPDVTVRVIPDPLTTVKGRLVDSLRLPISGALVSILGQFSATTLSDGTFSLSGIPTARGNIVVFARATIGGVLGLAVSAPTAPALSGTTNVGDFVWTSTSRFVYGTNYNSDNISAYSINGTTGGLTAAPGAPFPAGGLPFSVTVDPMARFAYAANSGGNPNNISAYNIDGATGALTAIPGSPFPVGYNSYPLSVTMDPTARFVYVANYGSNNVSAYSINGTTGALAAVPGSPFLAGSSPYSVTVDPTSRFVYVANRGSSDISAYSINGTTGGLAAVPGSPFPAGGSPYSVTVDPTARFVYTANSNPGPNGISAYSINGTTGALTVVPGSPFPAGTYPQSVTVDPTARFVYAANYGSNNISAYSINGTTGGLAAVPGSPFPAESSPFSVTVDPTARFVYTGDSDSISAYSIDASTGALTRIVDSHSPFPAGRTERSITTVNRLTFGGDRSGIPPTIQLTSPAPGTQAIQGTTVTVTANATDDVAVATVSFFVNGQLAFTTARVPYQYTFTVPNTSGTLTLAAKAVDFGDNIGTSQNVQINLPSLTANSFQFGFGDSNGLSLLAPGDAGPTLGGYGRIQPNTGSTTPSSIAILGNRQNNVLVSETVIPASPLMSSGRIYAEISGPVVTGAAFANPNNQSAIISFFFTDANGQNFGQGTITVPASGQISSYFNEAPFNGIASARTVTFSSTVPVSVIGLRRFTNERGEFLITALPVGELSAPVGETIILPHFADGGGWTTQLLLPNSTDETISGTIQFFGQGGGQPITITLNDQTNTSFSYTIPPRGALKLQTSGSSASVQVGSVRIVPSPTNKPPAGFGLASLTTSGITPTQFVILASRPSLAFRLYAEASDTSSFPGFAIANLAPTTAVAKIEWTTLSGLATGQAQLAIPGNGQVAGILTQLFPTLPMPFQAVLRISTTSPSGLSVLGLRGRTNERGDFIYAGIPAIDENSTASGAEQIFPQILVGGSYSAQFILFSGSAGQSTSGTVRLFSQSGQPLTLTLSK